MEEFNKAVTHDSVDEEGEYARPGSDEKISTTTPLLPQTSRQHCWYEMNPPLLGKYQRI
jgi:hypothetical protein